MSPEIFVHVVEQSHRQVALAVARAWKLPTDVSQVIADCGTYSEVYSSSLINCVTLANAVAKRDAPYPQQVNMEENMAQIFAGCSIMGLEIEQIDEIVADLEERLAEEGG